MESLESGDLVDICTIALLTLKYQRNRCPCAIFTSSNSHVKRWCVR